MWILATSASAALLNSFGGRLDCNNWSEGVYFLPESLRTAVVAINQLPHTPETLWLRILGRGATQEQTIAELIALPPGNPLRRNVLELISIWRVNLQKKENLTKDERELIVNLSPAYMQWREDTLREGRQEVVENLLRERFGNVDEALSRVTEPLLQLSSQESVRLVLKLSREDLLARFEITNI